MDDIQKVCNSILIKNFVPSLYFQTINNKYFLKNKAINKTNQYKKNIYAQNTKQEKDITIAYK